MIEPIPSSGRSKQLGLWLAALFLTVLGAKLWVVQLYGSALPFWDQWVEADQFFRPWMEGHLTWSAFVAPHNEHRILFTRLLDIGLISLNGQWSPLLQMTVNAFIHAGFACGLAYCLWDFLGRKNGWLVCLLLAMLFALPYAAENTIRGFHSQQHFLSIFSLATLAGLGFGKLGDRRWWFGLTAAVMSLFTMGSGFLAPMAVGGLMILRTLQCRRIEKETLLTLGASLAVVGLGLALNVTVAEHQSFRARTVGDFTSALARNLSWPFLDNPAMVGVVCLPVVLLAVLYFRPDFHERRAAEFLLIFGLWGFLQSAALAYGRANYEESQASRYMDVLNIVATASMFSALLLAQSAGGSRVATALSLVFAGVMILGVCRISQQTVGNFLTPSRMNSLVEEERVNAFITSGKTDVLLEPPTVRPDPELTARLLRNERLSAIIPPSCRPGEAVEHGRLSPASGWLLQYSVAVLASGLILFFGLCGCGLARGTMGFARGAPAGFVALLIGLAALGFVWSKHSLQREAIERELHTELSSQFRAANNFERATAHENMAKMLTR